MKTAKLTLFAIAIIAIVIEGCKSKKSVTTSNAPVSTPTQVATTTPTTSAFMVGRSADGIYEPANQELLAIQTKFIDVTLEQLKEGYFIYAKGACINCHGAKDIYKRAESRWKDIIDNMAPMAKLSEPQKDAVYKYVLAIKATQPK